MLFSLVGFVYVWWVLGVFGEVVVLLLFILQLVAFSLCSDLNTVCFWFTYEFFFPLLLKFALVCVNMLNNSVLVSVLKRILTFTISAHKFCFSGIYCKVFVH